jgi:hypothetical protein
VKDPEEALELARRRARGERDSVEHASVEGASVEGARGGGASVEGARGEGASVESARGGGDPGGGADIPWRLERAAVHARQLSQWAIVDPDRIELYSTRRLGRPFTALRRLLARTQRQYMGELMAQQSRFNARVTEYLERLERRIDALERPSEADDEPSGGR